MWGVMHQRPSRQDTERGEGEGGKARDRRIERKQRERESTEQRATWETWCRCCTSANMATCQLVSLLPKVYRRTGCWGQILRGNFVSATQFSSRGPSKGKFGKCLLVRSRSLTRRRASISSPLRRLGPCRELWCSCHWRSPPRRSWQPARPSRHRVCTRVSGSTAQAHAPARSPCALPWARDPRPRSTHARAHTQIHRFYTPNSLALTHRHSSTHTPQKQTCARTPQHPHPLSFALVNTNMHIYPCAWLSLPLFTALCCSGRIACTVQLTPLQNARRCESRRSGLRDR